MPRKNTAAALARANAEAAKLSEVNLLSVRPRRKACEAKLQNSACTRLMVGNGARVRNVKVKSKKLLGKLASRSSSPCVHLVVNGKLTEKFFA